MMRLMATCENKRTKAYSSDLRWRMVWQARVLQKSYKEIADNLNVDKSTVSRTVALFDATGNIACKKYPPNPSTATLTDIDKLIILELVIDQPGIYLREIQREIEEQTGTEADESTICRFLHASGFSRQKLIVTAQERSDVLRAQYQMDMSVYKGHPELMVFVDETGADRRDCMRRFGYCLKGKPSKVQKLLWRGARVSTIAAISYDGLLDCYTTLTSVDADKFSHFITSSLIPKLQPFNGVNRNSVVILDNASIHHSSGIVQSIEQTGALVQFLPPYSPDFNPIEETFSKVKAVMRANEQLEFDTDAEVAVLSAFNTVTVDDCVQWITHCGYT